jgi:CRISPR-associated protein Csx10
LRSRWREIAPLCEDTAQQYPHIFTINLRSDAILKEHGWLPTTVLTAEMLRAATGVADPSLCLLRSYTSYDYRGGWNAGQRLPKDTELVTRLGSLFVFQTEDLTPWYAPLADLEVRGIGERAAEGFGEVRVCDNFHIAGRKRQ